MEQIANPLPSQDDIDASIQDIDCTVICVPRALYENVICLDFNSLGPDRTTPEEAFISLDEP